MIQVQLSPLVPIHSYYEHYASVQDIQYQLLQYTHNPHYEGWPKFH